MLTVKLKNVEIPVDVTHFITPDWHRVLYFYPRWRRLVRQDGGTPGPIQEYLLLYAEELERLGCEGSLAEKLSSDEWISVYIRHYGLSHLERAVRFSEEEVDFA